MNSQTLSVTHRNLNLSIAAKRRNNPQSDTTLVFLHGLGCAKECFDKAFEADTLKEFSLLTFDFPGYEESSKPDGFSYSMEDQAEVALSVIKQLETKKTVLVAHSMGGTIGLLAAQQLDNLVGFVNVEGNLVAEDAGIISRRTADQPESEFLAHGFDNFLAGLKNAGRSDFSAWAEWYEKSDRRAVYRSSQSLVEWSDSGKLMSYFNELPHKAFIYGDEESKDYLLRQFRDVKTHCIPNSGHFMMLDDPEKFYEAIGEFIQADR